MSAPVEIARTEFATLGHELGVQTWPVVLGPGLGAIATEPVRGQVITPGTSVSGGPASSGNAPGWIQDALATLADAERQVEIRDIADGRVVRHCLARRGHHHVLASTVTTTGCDEGTDQPITLSEPAIGSSEDIGATVRRLLGDTEAVEFAGFSVPGDVLTRGLIEAEVTVGEASSGSRIGVVADILIAYGVRPADAIVAAGVATAHRRVEIALDASHTHRRRISSGDSGAPMTSGDALVAFDTTRGRILANPTTASDGRVWMTFTPGTGHRIAQATCLLVETGYGRWMP